MDEFIQTLAKRWDGTATNALFDGGRLGLEDIIEICNEVRRHTRESVEYPVADLRRVAERLKDMEILELNGDVPQGSDCGRLGRDVSRALDKIREGL